MTIEEFFFFSWFSGPIRTRSPLTPYFLSVSIAEPLTRLYKIHTKHLYIPLCSSFNVNMKLHNHIRGQSSQMGWYLACGCVVRDWLTLGFHRQPRLSTYIGRLEVGGMYSPLFLYGLFSDQDSAWSNIKSRPMLHSLLHVLRLLRGHLARSRYQKPRRLYTTKISTASTNNTLYSIHALK